MLISKYFLYLCKKELENINKMANFLLKKTIASALGMESSQVDAILKASEAFKSNSINRDLAIRVFDKVSKKTPSEINELLNITDKNS